MGARLAVVVAAVAIVLALGFLTVSAQGAPSAPSAKLSGSINPAVSQTLQVTFTSQAYSLVVPNSIYETGSYFVYSAWQTNAYGTTTTLAQSQSVAVTPTGYSNGVYTLTATVSLWLSSICSGASCAAQTFNLTIHVNAQVHSYLGFWVSSTSDIVFSNVGSYNHVPAVAPADPSTYYYELFVPVTGIVATIGILGYAAGWRNPVVLGIGIAALIAIAVEIPIWVR